jgi:hypothetical protein
MERSTDLPHTVVVLKRLGGGDIASVDGMSASSESHFGSVAVGFLSRNQSPTWPVMVAPTCFSLDAPAALDIRAGTIVWIIQRRTSQGRMFLRKS